MSAGQRYGGSQECGPLGRRSVHLSVDEVGGGRLRGTAVLSTTGEEGPTDSALLRFEGEIVDNREFTFKTGKWGASFEDDMESWAAFVGFDNLTEGFGKGIFPDRDLHQIDLSEMDCIFMRWKEVSVGSPAMGEGHFALGYDIGGFYYVCMDRASGGISALYFDPQRRAERSLMLNPVMPVPFQLAMGAGMSSDNAANNAANNAQASSASRTGRGAQGRRGTARGRGAARGQGARVIRGVPGDGPAPVVRGEQGVQVPTGVQVAGNAVGAPIARAVQGAQEAQVGNSS